VRDVIVVGAGPAGAATAAHLARAGRSVLLVDKARFPRAKPCAEYASPETEPVLRRLGVWPALEAGVRRLRGMVIVSPSGQRFRSEYLDGGRRRCSLALPRRFVDDQLLRHAVSSGAEFRSGLLAEAPILDGELVVGIRARRSDRTTEELHARLVVGADGLRSRLAALLGGGRPSRWPRRLGLATHYRGLPSPPDWGEMYVGRGGYCGLAPVGDGLTTLAAALPLDGSRAQGRPRWTLDLGPARRLALALPEHPQLLARLARAERIEPFRGVGPLAWRVPRVTGRGFLLVGDAAGFFDPFTGEGIFRALRGAELAAECALGVLVDGDWSALVSRYRELRRMAFAAKERLARMIQLFVNCPPLLDYALARLERRPELAERLSAALGDFGPAGVPLQPAYLARLLRP
jgi:flavin-dependent dehydrogenase